MNSKTKTILGIVVFVVLIVGATLVYNGLQDKYRADENQEPADNSTKTDLQAAPDFSAVDASGKTVKLSDFKGKPVVVNFWASWCGPCKAELPDFEKEYVQVKDKVVFMMVNMTDGERETVASAKKYVDGQGFTFPLYFDTLGEAATAYQINSIPMTLIIDKDGNLVKSFIGQIEAKTLTSAVALLNQ